MFSTMMGQTGIPGPVSRFKIQDSRFKIQDSRFKIQEERVVVRIRVRLSVSGLFYSPK